MMEDTPRPFVLIVEDDEAVRRSLQLLLHWRGYDVRAFASATPVMESEGVMRAAALVTDYQLPDGDGIAILDAMKKAGWNGQAVLVTGHSTPELETAAIAQGFSAVLSKPLRQHELVGLLAH